VIYALPQIHATERTIYLLKPKVKSLEPLISSDTSLR
jgi:hypothetical protein